MVERFKFDPYHTVHGRTSQNLKYTKILICGRASLKHGRASQICYNVNIRSCVSNLIHIYGARSYVLLEYYV